MTSAIAGKKIVVLAILLSAVLSLVPISFVSAAEPQSQSDCPAGTRFSPASFNDNGTKNGENQCVPAGAFAGQNQNGRDVSCAGDWWNYIHPACLMRWGFSYFGAALIWLGVKFAVIGGSIFETALKYTVVEFGSYMQQLKPGIDTAWTALRDIANIVIIGMFVFIAVNMILGVKEFGERKFVARLLIVAVLINFSLLFTKVIVDASNFTAYQFYNQMVKGATAEPTTVAGVEITESVIAARFMQYLGVAGFTDSAEKLTKVAEDNKNAFYALGYGLLSFIFLMATAFVFLYGAFLLVSRAVLVVFLMLTSALAFSTWLIPQHYIEKGFSKWWESLLKTAFFAPILIALLWSTMIVSARIAGSTTGGHAGTLGALAGKASDGANAYALLGFLLILGLLFASFAAASAFSKTIGGFKFAATLPMLGLAGASRIGRFAGTQVLGRAGTYVGGKLEDRAKTTKAGTWSNYLYDKGAQTFKKQLGQRNFDFMKTKLAKEVGKVSALGAEDLAGKDIGGFEGVQKEYLKRMKEQAERTTLTDEEKQKLRAKGIESTMAENPELKGKYDEAKGGAEAAVAHHEKTEKESTERMADLSKDIQRLDETYRNAQITHDTATPADKPGTQRALDEARRNLENKKGEFRAEKQRIESAKQAAQAATAELHRVVKGVEKVAEETGKIPAVVKESKADRGKALVESSYTATLLKATNFSPKKLAEKLEGQLGGPTKVKTITEKSVIDIIKDSDKMKKKAEVAEKKALGVFKGDGDAKSEEAKEDKH